MFKSLYKSRIELMEAFLEQKRIYIKFLKEKNNILEQENKTLKEQKNNPYQTVEQIENRIGHWVWDKKHQLYRYLSSITSRQSSYDIYKLNFREYSIDYYDEIKNIKDNGVKTCAFEPNRFYPYEINE